MATKGVRLFGSCIGASLGDAFRIVRPEVSK